MSIKADHPHLSIRTLQIILPMCRDYSVASNGGSWRFKLPNGVVTIGYAGDGKWEASAWDFRDDPSLWDDDTYGTYDDVSEKDVVELCLRVAGY